MGRKQGDRVRTIEARETLAEVLRDDVLSVSELQEPTDESGLIVRFRSGDTMFLDVEAAAHPSPDQITRLVESSRPPRRVRATDLVPVLVADVLSALAKGVLAEAGWGFFDRRGHLYLRAGARHLEMTVPARPRSEVGSPRAGIRGASGATVAFAQLLEPERVLGVRELSRASGLRSPTSVSNARQALRQANLLEPDGRPVVPDLFWALAGHWKRPLQGLASVPTPEVVGTLGHNIDGPYYESLHQLGQSEGADAFEGVGVSGDLAAELYGAPVVRTTESPIDLYLPGPVAISRLKRRYGEPRHLTERAAGVRSFPISLAARTRLPGKPGSRGFPLVHPLVVALDLAQDPARGREILDGFDPEGFPRVW